MVPIIDRQSKILSSFWGMVFHKRNIILLGSTTKKKHYTIMCHHCTVQPCKSKPRILGGFRGRMNEAVSRNRASLTGYLGCPCIPQMLYPRF